MFGWLASCMVIVFLMCKNINMHTYYTYSFTLILAVNLLKKRKEKKTIFTAAYAYKKRYQK